MPSILLLREMMNPERTRGRGGDYTSQWDEAALTWPVDDHMEMEVDWEYWTAPKGVGLRGKSFREPVV
jgi:hypothetical protein